MANPWRGDAVIVIDGKAHAMRLTLGSLAELETKLGAGSLVELVERFESSAYSAGDVIDLLEAGLAGGNCQVARERLLNGAIEGGPLAGARAAAELLARAFAVPKA
jgi:hypothetical protein